MTILDTKNHQQHVLPLSDFLYQMLKSRQLNASDKYIFPGEGKTGYVGEPRKAMGKVISASGIKFTLHDLRRTFITIAESLDIPAYALKRLLNHKMNQDVTAGYIVIDAERLRMPMPMPMQMITDRLMSLMGMKKTDEGKTSINQEEAAESAVV